MHACGFIRFSQFPHVTAFQSVHIQREQVIRRSLIKTTTAQKDPSHKLHPNTASILISPHWEKPGWLQVSVLICFIIRVDQRAGTVARWSREGKWKTKARGTEPTMKTFSCEREPGIAALGMQESSLMFLKALRWLGLTLHGMTLVQMLRVVRGASGSSQTLDPFITKTSSGCTIMENSRKEQFVWMQNRQ